MVWKDTTCRSGKFALSHLFWFMEGQRGQKEHFLILINYFLILIIDFLILINDFLILINYFLILKNDFLMSINGIIS